MEKKRTHYCGELRLKDAGKETVLMGWVQRRRDHGGLIFIDLRDRTGIVQIVFDPTINEQSHKLAHDIRNEYVLAVNGKIRQRPEDTENLELPTGQIEMAVEKLEILNTAETPPFVIEDELNVSEEIRLKYRYLDLRRPKMQNNFLVRHNATFATRQYLTERGFLEIETPYIANSTPEGARDLLIPSRLYKGKFYAMPQSPQQFKQLLMMSGFDKYYQMAKCFRDEDTRADRQLEFTQIDIEMSFVGQEEIFELTEGLMEKIFKVIDVDIKTPLPRLTYADAIDRYGIDKPDTRFGMELQDVADIVNDSDFRVFTSVIEKGGQVKGIVAPNCSDDFSRKDLDDLTDFAKTFGAKGMAWMKVTEDGINTPIAKFFSDEIVQELKDKMRAKTGDILLFIADQPQIVAETLAQLRLKLGKQLGLINKNRYDLLWVVDFPLFTRNDDEKRYDSEHHPFTAANPNDLLLLDTEPAKVRSLSYDLVINGVEIASGSVRNHKSDIQEKIFKILQLKPEQIKERFGFFLQALQYGTPPHAGIAVGFDRLIMLMTQNKTIREVIAFPKTQKGTCLVTGAPSEVEEKQLQELGIAVEEVVES